MFDFFKKKEKAVVEKEKTVVEETVVIEELIVTTMEELSKINEEFYCHCDRIPLTQEGISSLSQGDPVGIVHGGGFPGVSCGFIVNNSAGVTVVKVNERCGREGGEWNEYIFLNGQLQGYQGYLCRVEFRTRVGFRKSKIIKS